MLSVFIFNQIGLHKIFQFTNTKKMKRKQFWISYIFLWLTCIMLIAMPVIDILQIEDNFLVNYEDVESANENHMFGSYITGKLNQKEQSVGTDKVKSGEIVFKLFGFIPIRKISVVMASDDDYYIGGTPIGLSIVTDGAIVISDNNDSIQEGDIITKINGKDFNEIDDFQNVLSGNDEAEVTYLRKNKEFKTLVKVLKDKKNKYKLGLTVKDSVTGVGTLTFVNKNTKEYGALGHAIVDEIGGNIVPIESGKVYPCNLIGINKGQKNNPGQLRCVFVQNGKDKGSIVNNTKFGINGTLSNLNGLVDENLTAKIGGRLSVKPGRATIVSDISGIKEEYEIEIIKANYQKKANDKSLVFRVTDKRLLSLTGGIVQGMSGSPIMQNGKIVGAVTHVFLSDPTKGYGVYCDFMLEQI